MRFFAMFFLTGGYFFVELIWGIAIGSLALVADAMHMLSDFIALCVGFYAARVSKKQKTDDATYGFSRMEVVGGLMNGTFLLAVCLSILMEAGQRFFESENDKLAENGQELLIVGSVGLLVNILGMFIFGHGHGHGGHGHSHGGSAPAPSNSGGDHGHSHGGETAPSSGGHGHSHGGGGGGEGNMNVQGVFLHVLGDALGSIAVMISAIVIIYSDSPHRFLADPICGLLITIIIALGAIPLGMLPSFFSSFESFVGSFCWFFFGVFRLFFLLFLLLYFVLSLFLSISLSSRQQSMPLSRCFFNKFPREWTLPSLKKSSWRLKESRKSTSFTSGNLLLRNESVLSIVSSSKVPISWSSVTV